MVPELWVDGKENGVVPALPGLFPPRGDRKAHVKIIVKGQVGNINKHKPAERDGMFIASPLPLLV